MSRTKASVIILMVLISFTCAQVDKTTTPKTTTTETPIDPETSPRTTTSTLAPTTSATTEPTTTTTTTTTSTTTTTPSTTSVAPPSTTPRPVPPPPEYKKYSYGNENQTCVIVQFAMQFNLTYTTNDDKPSSALFNVPVNGTTVPTGSCGNDSQSITIQWQTSKMILDFTVNNTAQEFMLSKIYVSINASQDISDAKADQIIELYHVNNDFATPLAMSYHCNKIQTLQFADSKDSKNYIVNATVSHVQLEAFHKQKTSEFATARDCEAIDTPDIVPIAVGCALAGLVIIVLIAYLIGRRRAQARGYLSM